MKLRPKNAASPLRFVWASSQKGLQEQETKTGGEEKTPPPVHVVQYSTAKIFAWPLCGV